MSTKMRPELWSMTIALSFTLSAAASPPPVPPPYITDLAKKVILTATPASFEQYAAILADDLAVSVDGRQVASGKAAWLAMERSRIGKVDRKVLAYVEGYDSILVIDRYDDQSDVLAKSDFLFDPRYKTRATQFAVGTDQHIHAIRIVQSDGVIQTPP